MEDEQEASWQQMWATQSLLISHAACWSPEFPLLPRYRENPPSTFPGNDYRFPTLCSLVERLRAPRGGHPFRGVLHGDVFVDVLRCHRDLRGISARRLSGLHATHTPAHVCPLYPVPASILRHRKSRDVEEQTKAQSAPHITNCSIFKQTQTLFLFGSETAPRLPVGTPRGGGGGALRS